MKFQWEKYLRNKLDIAIPKGWMKLSLFGPVRVWDKPGFINYIVKRVRELEYIIEEYNEKKLGRDNKK